MPEAPRITAEPQFDDVEVGDALPPLAVAPISRSTLALYAGASGDHNPIHIDVDFARQAGLPDVFAHGMLSAAYLGRLLTGWVRQEAIRQVTMRFTGITNVHEAPTCTGRVVQKFVAADEKCVRVEIKSSVGSSDKIVGEAVIALE